MRLGILGVPDAPYVRDLQRACSERQGLECEVIKFSDLQAAISHDPDFALMLENGAYKYQALIVRSMPLGSLEQIVFRMDCLQVLESRGVQVLNRPRVLEAAVDKWLTLHRLQQSGVRVPNTVACQNRNAAMLAFEQLGGDVLVKPLFGGEGKGIVRVQDKDIAWRVFGAVQQYGQVIYVQQFIEHFGYDVRVLFVGQRIFSMKRIAVEGGWRTNLSQGSRAEAYIPSDAEMEVAQQSLRAIGGGVIGVDILPARDGRLYVLEVNAVPGWNGIRAATGVDIAAEVVSYAISRVEGLVPQETLS